MKALGQTVLVLQGGGALGAYQVGVYEALAETGVEPDWVVGTSIGAINASLIAGSPKSERIDRLCEFWKRVEQGNGFTNFMPQWLAATARNTITVSAGVPSFSSPSRPHLSAPICRSAPMRRVTIRRVRSWRRSRNSSTSIS
jgi:NTE family protein